MNIWRVHSTFGSGDLTRCAFGILGLSSCTDVQLSLNALLRQPFALVFPAGTSELHSHRTASGQASSHMLGPTYASGGTRQVGRDERTGWATARRHIQYPTKRWDSLLNLMLSGKPQSLTVMAMKTKQEEWTRGEGKMERNHDSTWVQSECFRARKHSECTPRCYCNLLLLRLCVGGRSTQVYIYIQSDVK